MADRKLSASTALTGAAADTANDLVAVLDVSDTTDAATGTLKKMTLAELENVYVAGSLVGTTDTQTLTNKTIDTASNTITVAEADISDLGSYISTSSTDTLSNKTINTSSNTITVVEADISDLGSYITASSTDSLTNKTINTASNTITVVEADISDLGSYITASSSDTLTNKTFDANGSGNSLSNVETADIAAGSKSGSDTTLITGTAGTNGDLAQWNGDGDVVDGPTPPSGTIVGTTDVQTLTNKDISNANNTYRAASTTATGAVELATTAETDTGTDTGRVITPDGLAGSIFGTKNVLLKVIADDEALATGDNQYKFVVPVELNGMDLVTVGAHVYTVSSSGAPSIMVHNLTDTTDMLSTAITIDANEKDSATAATPAVINTAADDVVTGDEIRIDVDAAGTGTAGLEVRLGFRLP